MATSSNNDTSVWLKFFSSAGIPTKQGVLYARLFIEQRIQKSMLADLDKPTLREIGIVAVGDQIAILKQIKAQTEMETEKVTLDSLKSDIVKQKARIAPPAIRSSSAAAPVTTKMTAAPVRAQIATPVPKKIIRLTPSSVSSVSEDDEVNEVSAVKRKKPAPDFDVIYHVKMPVGSTPKSRELLKTVATLKAIGVSPAGRGVSGVRQSGRPVAAKSTVFCRLGAAAGPETDVLTSVYKRKLPVQPASPEVTSTTGGEGFDDFDEEDEFDDPEETLASDRLNRKKSALSRLGGTSGRISTTVPTSISSTLLNRAKLTAVKRTMVNENIAKSALVTVRLNAQPLRKGQQMSAGLTGRLGGNSNSSNRTVGLGGSNKAVDGVKARLGAPTAAVSSGPATKNTAGIRNRLG